MGANLNTYQFPATYDKKTIQEKWNHAVDMSLHEDGHSYSGEIGMLGKKIDWNDYKVFKNQDEAEDYIANNQEKFDNAIAVRFVSTGNDYWLIGGWCSS